MPSSSEIRATLCLWGGCIRLLTSALTASLYRRIGHVLKPPDGWIKGVTSFLKPGAAWNQVNGNSRPAGGGARHEKILQRYEKAKQLLSKNKKLTEG